MDIRLLSRADGDAYLSLREYCFGASPADGPTWLAKGFHPDQSLGAFDQGILQAVSRTIPYRFYVGAGAPVAMGGVASVVSDPSGRRGGVVGRLLTESLALMRARGQIVSALNAFDIGFYRRYGWELAGYSATWKLATAELRDLAKSPGHVRRYTPQTATALVAAAGPVYNQHAAGRPGFMVRDGEDHWHLFVLHIFRSGVNWHAATWHPTADAPAEGYVLYKFTGEDRNLQVSELIAHTPAAYRGLLGYLANHDSQAKQTEISGPAESPLGLVLSTATKAGVQLKPTFTVRIVDLVPALAAKAVPAHLRGSFTLDLTDREAPWNHGRWHIAFAGGQTTVTPADSPADATCDIATLSGLYTSGFTPQSAVLAGRLAISPAAADLVAAAWSGPRWFQYEYF